MPRASLSWDTFGGGTSTLIDSTYESHHTRRKVHEYMNEQEVVKLGTGELACTSAAASWVAAIMLVAFSAHSGDVAWHVISALYIC